MRPAVLAVVGLLVLVPACGGEGTAVTEAAAIQLEPKVQALRQATAEGRREAAGDELVDLRRLVDELSASGDLEEDAARRILAAASEVEANLDLLATTTTTIPATSTTVPATTTPEPPPSPPAVDERPGKDKENEKKAGEDDDDEDDDGDDDDRPPPGNGPLPGNGNRPRG